MASLDNTTMGKFIPQLWSDEVIATYKANLVLANLVRNINHKGKKGNTINIPGATRGSASAKADGTVVSVQAISDSTNNTLSLSEHYQYSVRIDDITDLQALGSMRRFYTDDAGHALAEQVDSKIVSDLRDATSGVSISSIGSDGWDAAILEGIEDLNNVNAPMNDRALVVSPACMTLMLQVARFTEQAFIGDGGALKTGKIGQIYGVDVYVSTQIHNATAKAILFQKEALVLATQQDVRVQTQYQQDYLADLLTADTVYGTLAVRPTSIIEMSA